ncbi:MAG: hypothetical protein ABFD44_02055 [Anaerolineaceae bacterium]
MKNIRFTRIILIGIILIFAALVGLALGANLIGLGRGTSWGIFRKAFLFVGTSGLIFTFLFVISEKIEKTMPPKHVTSSNETSHKRDYSSNTRSKTKTILSIIGILLAVEILYVGFISVWNWVDWPVSTNYYGMLGKAFLQGNTYLPIEPSPRLAELKNPYLSSERGGIPVETDLSYFNQKYYMYWGPAPAAVAAIVTLLTGQVPGDEHIVFGAISVAFLFLLLIIQDLKQRFFPTIPGWLYGLGILSIATSFPFLWVLNSPDIYGAAIASGQAFLLGGLFFALPALGGDHSPRWRLALAGVFWILAIGSRLVLVVPVAVLLGGIFVQWFLQARKKRNWANMISPLISLLTPMAVGVIMLGFYNYVRFGNFLETGLRYSLNPHDLYTNIPGGFVFNPRYLLSDLLYYFVTPIRTVTKFPFLKPYWGPVDGFTRILKPVGIPDIYTIDNSVGLLFTIPTILFLGYLIVSLFKGLNVSRQNGEATSAQCCNPDLSYNARFTLGFILLAGIAASLPILTYFYVSCRYLLDFLPLLNIPIVAGMWQLFRVYNHYPIRRWFIIILVVAFVIYTTGVGFTIALTGAQTRFDDCNPILFQTLSQFFR